MSEEEKGKMDKKSNPRLCSPVQKNGTDIRKDNNSRNPRWGKRRGNCSSGNYSNNDGQGKKPTPQKYKNTWDKRPRPHGDLSERPRSNLEENYEAEYGSAIPTGSKKGNLNHLLNFSYGEDEGSYRQRGGGARGGWGRPRSVRYQGGSYNRGSRVYYNKEQFLQANCQFVVQEARDYTAHLMDPDTLVDWDAIEQVRVLGVEPPSCPICLGFPVAGRMTRCGHVYCWACILHYLALGEKTWNKCPICYEAIHSQDLKSVSSRQVQHYKVGDTITMTLMRKEKGSIYAVPANLWQKSSFKCHNVEESEGVTRHMKLLTTRPDQVLQQLEVESNELAAQLAAAENSEEPFIKGAQEQLKAKQALILETPKPRTDSHCSDTDEVTPELDVPTFKHSPQEKKIKTYKSAFSDEEVEGEEADASAAEPDTATADSQIGQVEDDAEDSASASPTKMPEEPASPSLPEEPPLAQSQDPVALMPGSLPVDEAAEQLELPSQSAGGKTRNTSGDHSFYFYQSEDGQHIYLHSLNARCLVREYGSLQNSPQTITATIVEKESVFVSEELRKRLRYLAHLPLTCGFEVVELNIKAPVIGKDTLKHFNEEIEKRRRQRQRRNRDEKRMAKWIEEEERKKLGLTNSTIIPSQFGRLNAPVVEKSVDTRSDTSSPSLDTPIGSPGVPGAHFHPVRSPENAEADDGSQSSVVSFAQMLKAGTKAAPVWPKKKTDLPSGPAPSRRPQDSDESDNEDKVPVPEYQSSFGSAIEAALVNIDVKAEESEPNRAQAGKSSGKKKKKQLVLFSTSMARGGK